MRRRKRGRRILRCPHCSSPKILWDVSGLGGQSYYCPACDYRGALVIETEEAPPEEGR